MKKKLSSYFLISFLLFFPLLIYSQTIIKEKVTVSPKQTVSKIPNTVQEEQLIFQIEGQLPFSATVVGPTATQSGSSQTAGFLYLYFPPLNGNYQVTISSTLSAGQRIEVGYTAIYQDRGIAYEGRWLYNGGEESAVVSTTINVTINSFLEETPVEFSLYLGSDYICSSIESSLSIVNYNQPVTPTTNVKFNIIGTVQGVELYNKNTGEIITSETPVHITEVSNLSIRLATPYQGSDAIANVTAEIGGVTRTDSLTIIGSGNYFRLYSQKRIWDMLEGGTIEMSVEMEGESDCDDVRLQDTTKYNLTMTEGEAYGHIIHQVTGELVTTANNLSHENGKLKFKFRADGELPTSEEWARVRVTTTNPGISPYEFIIKIHKEGMIVMLVPENIMPGDTASIILKKKNADGTLTDFPEDQYYDAEIIGGAEYGTLYVPQWGDLSDYLLDIPPGFKFIAEEGISEPKVESTILVRTTAGIIWGRVTPGKTNNQNSVQNTTDEEQLWGEGTITIGEGKDTAYVKAYLAEENLVAGDTVEVIVKKVDQNGNETDFPLNTLFEVGIKEGCTAGNILTTSGEKGQYFINVGRPMRFVVNDFLSAADTNIVLRVGVPSDESTIYLSYEAAAPSGKILPLKGKMNSVTDQASDYCVLNQFEYSGFGLANGTIENMEIEITLTGEKSIWPKMINKRKSFEYNPFTNVKVTLKKNDKAMANQQVKLIVKRIEGTGGHDHIEPLSLNKCAQISYQGSRGNPLILTTNQNGEILTQEILSSEVGGIYCVEASIETKPTIKDTVQFLVKVPGLELLKEHYTFIKIGGTAKHNGPPDYIQDNNHWGSRDLNQAIVNLSMKWYNNFSNVPILSINDMSLHYGGLFDINGNWQSPHDTHRIGDCVDIQSRLMTGERFIDSNRNGRYDPGIDTLYDDNNNGQFDGGQLAIFRNLALDVGGFEKVNFETKPITKNEHWHLIK